MHEGSAIAANKMPIKKMYYQWTNRRTDRPADWHWGKDEAKMKNKIVTRHNADPFSSCARAQMSVGWSVCWSIGHVHARWFVGWLVCQSRNGLIRWSLGHLVGHFVGNYHLPGVLCVIATTLVLLHVLCYVYKSQSEGLVSLSIHIFHAAAICLVHH